MVQLLAKWANTRIAAAFLLWAATGAVARSQEDASLYAFPPSGNIEFERSVEWSGAVPAADGLSFWSMDDAGGGAELYRVTFAGDVVQEVKMTGAVNVDWEEIASGGGRLWIADTGDNRRVRASYAIYSIPEPGPGDDSAAAETHAFAYEDGAPRDCEAMVYADGTLFLISKSASLSEKPECFRYFPGDSTAERLGELPVEWIATGAAFSKETGQLAVLSYIGLQIYAVDDPAAAMTATPRLGFGFYGQAEAVTFFHSGLFVLNERGAFWTGLIDRFLDSTGVESWRMHD